MKKYAVTFLALALSLALLTACDASQKSESDARNRQNTNQTFANSISAVNAEDAFHGTWADEIAGRGVATITHLGDGTYDVSIEWGDSASEKNVWQMTAKPDDDGDELNYSNCTLLVRTYQDEKNYTEETVYTNGSGEFSIENGMLVWDDDHAEAEGENDEIRFIKVS